MKIDLRTDRQKALDAHHTKIAERYSYYKKVAEGASDNQIFQKLGEEFSITSIHARNICLAKGVATRKRMMA